MNEQANSGAAASWASAPTCIASIPGRRMITVPRKPAITAAIRRARNFSPRNSTAPMVVNSGAVNPIAVTSAIGMRAIAKNHRMTPPPCTTPRSTCRPIRRGISRVRRVRYRNGSMKPSPIA